MQRYTTPPSIDDIAELAEAALGALPQELRASIRGVAILVEEVPDDDTLAEMELDHPWELTGLYRGRPLTGRSSTDVPMEPDTIQLYRESILVEWVESGEDLFRLVRNVLIHEIGHHFGFSDEEIARLEGEE
ncbi:metallopeptidase family protein [Roseomonas sp. OT10]|uniref:metallopeptidase family protein n=1 Tax=Roseomonas cutis TaxID=2897332 RepID=UPI001E57B527|nr:metallopeptidase family protein [Roseomonas sp. OT10]UFN51380.1 metallopeptidase family protein [Roseomonas sp. OT10]